jgi:hypothetical protein
MWLNKENRTANAPRKWIGRPSHNSIQTRPVPGKSLKEQFYLHPHFGFFLLKIKKNSYESERDDNHADIRAASSENKGLKLMAVKDTSTCHSNIRILPVSALWSDTLRNVPS